MKNLSSPPPTPTPGHLEPHESEDTTHTPVASSERPRSEPLYLVTGATGYVGGRLVPHLVAQGKRVRILVRNPARVRDLPWSGNVEVVQGDAADPDSLTRALEEVDIAYYLLHSLQHGAELESEEARIAHTFADAARRSGVQRIVYLGGLAPEGDRQHMSRHMRSRTQVGDILRASGVPTCELRAAVIIGSGSASFEMLRYLTERLPAMVTPRWVRQRTQPIAIADVIHYLEHAAHLDKNVNRSFDIGGTEVMTYQEMMQRYAAVAGLPKRLILPINVLSPGLSSHWVGLVTPVPRNLARPLVESLRHPAVCREHDIARYIDEPPSGPTPFDAAVALALGQTQEGRVPTRWSDASTPGAPSDPLPSDPDWAGGSVYTDVRVVHSDAKPQELWAHVEGIGGAHGYYSGRILWEARGLIDRAVGGVGLRRGRRDADRLVVGEAVDFWRVEERIPPRLLRLRAEMRMPGHAWLEFTVEPDPQGGSHLTQRAIFHPRGLSGHAYWWAVSPFHRFVFPGMAQHLAGHPQAGTATHQSAQPALRAPETRAAAGSGAADSATSRAAERLRQKLRESLTRRFGRVRNHP